MIPADNPNYGENGQELKNELCAVKRNQNPDLQALFGERQDGLVSRFKSVVWHISMGDFVSGKASRFFLSDLLSDFLSDFCVGFVCWIFCAMIGGQTVLPISLPICLRIFGIIPSDFASDFLVGFFCSALSLET